MEGTTPIPKQFDTILVLDFGSQCALFCSLSISRAEIKSLVHVQTYATSFLRSLPAQRQLKDLILTVSFDHPKIQRA